MNSLCEHTHAHKHTPGTRTLTSISHLTPLTTKKGMREEGRESQPLPVSHYSNPLSFQVLQHSLPTEATPVITMASHLELVLLRNRKRFPNLITHL